MKKNIKKIKKNPTIIRGYNEREQSEILNEAASTGNYKLIISIFNFILPSLQNEAIEILSNTNILDFSNNYLNSNFNVFMKIGVSKSDNELLYRLATIALQEPELYESELKFLRQTLSIEGINIDEPYPYNEETTTEPKKKAKLFTSFKNHQNTDNKEPDINYNPFYEVPSEDENPTFVEEEPKIKINFKEIFAKIPKFVGTALGQTKNKLNIFTTKFTQNIMPNIIKGIKESHTSFTNSKIYIRYLLITKKYDIVCSKIDAGTITISDLNSNDISNMFTYFKDHNKGTIINDAFEKLSMEQKSMAIMNSHNTKEFELDNTVIKNNFELFLRVSIVNKYNDYLLKIAEIACKEPDVYYKDINTIRNYIIDIGLNEETYKITRINGFANTDFIVHIINSDYNAFYLNRIPLEEKITFLKIFLSLNPSLEYFKNYTLNLSNPKIMFTAIMQSDMDKRDKSEYLYVLKDLVDAIDRSEIISAILELDVLSVVIRLKNNAQNFDEKSNSNNKNLIITYLLTKPSVEEFRKFALEKGNYQAIYHALLKIQLEEKIAIDQYLLVLYSIIEKENTICSDIIKDIIKSNNLTNIRKIMHTLSPEEQDYYVAYTTKNIPTSTINIICATDCRETSIDIYGLIFTCGPQSLLYLGKNINEKYLLPILKKIIEISPDLYLDFLIKIDEDFSRTLKAVSFIVKNGHKSKFESEVQKQMDYIYQKYILEDGVTLH